MGRNENQRRTRRSSKRKRKNLSTRNIEEIFQSKFLKRLEQFESMYSFDQVCDPASMFQDTLGLSEFILGEFVEESSDNFMDAMFEKNDKDTSYENAMDEEDYQVSVSDIYEGPNSTVYSPCSYMCQRGETGSPASCSSEGSHASSTPNTYQLPYSYSYGSDQIARSTLPYPAYAGYQGGRKRKVHDEELPEEEREKRRIRRQRNKEAALRCRTRRRERIEVLEKETEDLEGQNNEVRTDISCLQAQLKQLEHMLQEHVCDKEL